MDINNLDRVVLHYYAAALAPATKKTYKAAEKRYLQFCKDFALQALPTSENLLCYFVACLGQQGLAHSTIKTYLSGVRQIQMAHGLQDPHIDQMARLRQVLKGVKIEAGNQGKPPRSRLPITPMILRKLKGVWLGIEHSADNLMLWAASTTTFFTFCRSGEITVENERSYDPSCHLAYEDVAVDDATAPQALSIRLKCSKTDQERRGVRVVVGRTGNDLCPVTALLNYLAARGDKPGPLFRWMDGSPLSRTRFVAEVRKALSQANLPASSFAGHSFRIGAATTAASAGVEDSTIQTLGRWKSDSYLLYVRLEPHRLAAVSATLANCKI